MELQTGEIEVIPFEALKKMDNFVRDVEVKRDECPRWKPGKKLTKSGAILAGTTYVCKPKYAMRLNIFVKNAFKAQPGEDDPWSLQAIDRAANFTVAEVFNHGDVIQYTVVEIDDDQLNSNAGYVLDEQGQNYVRNQLIASYAIPTPSYTNNSVFKEVMGNNTCGYRHAALWEIDELSQDVKGGESVIAIDDPRFEILYRVNTKDADYALIMDQAEKQSSYTPDIYKTAYFVKIENDELKICGKGQPTFAYLCDAYIEGNYNYDECAEPIIKITNKAKFASGNINLSKESGKPKRIASWVKDLDGKIIVTYLDGYQQDKTEFDSFFELILYLFAHVAYPRAIAEQTRAKEQIETLKVNEHPSYVVIKLSNGLFRVQAKDRHENAHPSLEYIESQMNVEKLVHASLERNAISKLYDGELYPIMQMTRDMITDNVWFDPIGGKWFQPILSSKTDKELQELIAFYKQAKEEDPEGTIDEAQFMQLWKHKKYAYRGEIRFCLEEIRRMIADLELPYRLCFSISFDKQFEEGRVNIFAPDIALFPNKLVKPGDYLTYKPVMMDRKTKNGKYADLVAKLTMLVLCLVKTAAPWITSVSCNVFTKRQDELQCIATGVFPEKRLCALELEDSLKALVRLRSIGLTFEKDTHNALLPIDPVFTIEEGCDYRFGFEFIQSDILIPEWYPYIGHDNPYDDLAVINNELKNIETSILEFDFDDVIKIADACYDKAIEDYGLQAQLFSCHSDIEEAILKQDEENKNAIYLPRGISRIYSLVGAMRFDDSPTIAMELLEKAYDLNPANVHALRELIALAIKDNDLEEARALLDKCYKVAANRQVFAFVLRQYGYLCVENGEYDVAKELFTYAIAQDDSDENLSYCFNELRAIGAFDFSDDEMFPLDFEYAKQEVARVGYPTELDPCVVAATHKLADDVMRGEKYYDFTLIDALMALNERHSQHAEIATKLIERSLGGRIDTISVFDYIFKPVVLGSKELYTSIANWYGYVYEDGHPLAIPYIDAKQGLMMHVVALVDRDNYELLHTLDPVYRFKFTDDDDDLCPAYLRAYSDYPSLNLEDIALSLLELNKPTKEKDETRKLDMLNDLRDLEMPDNILVVLRKEGVEPEGVWVELVSVEEHPLQEQKTIYAKLVDSPFDNFGINKGDVVALKLEYDDELDKLIAYYDA